MTIAYIVPHLSGLAPRGECTCAGTAPGFPEHESYCGLPEPVESGSWCCGWTDGVCEGCPGRSRIWGAR